MDDKLHETKSVNGILRPGKINEIMCSALQYIVDEFRERENNTVQKISM